MILMSVIDVLRSVYTENPEFRYTTRLIDVLKAHGVVVTKPVRMFCQACVAAMNLMCSCLSIVWMYCAPHF